GGVVSPAEREAAREAAVAASLRQEEALLRELLPQVSQLLDGLGCPAEPPPELGLWLPGYAVAGERAEGAGACVVLVEPSPPQHQRRLAARAAAGGPVEVLRRGP
ncbi:hypothetical protein L6R49_13905, partial [Myxococcota bacterium]|nr:hypothetical protein [Myxococcota bacterium]